MNNIDGLSNLSNLSYLKTYLPGNLPTFLPVPGSLYAPGRALRVYFYFFFFFFLVYRLE